MKCVIIYFSQTGNTEKIAKAIQTGVKQAAGNCDLLEIRQANPLGLKEYDLIGIGSPVMGIEPANVSDFVSKMRFVGGKHIFTFSTHGTSPGLFFSSLYPQLKSRGLIVIGNADWYADCDLVHMTQPYPTAGHPDEIDLQEAENYGREMVMRSMRIAAGETNLIPAAPTPDATQAAAERQAHKTKEIIEAFPALIFHRKMPESSCTLCMDNCPTYGLDLPLILPYLANPCMDCEFCARICPTGALDIEEWLKPMDEGTAKIGTKMLAALEKAENEGNLEERYQLRK